MRAVSITAGELLRLPVRMRGIQLGRPVDVVLDREHRRVLGVEVHCGDEERRFLPLAAASVEADALELPSPLVMLDRSELAFYTQRGSTFASLRGTSVARDGQPLGSLADVALAPDGSIETVVVDTAAGQLRVPYDDRVRIGAEHSTVRAAS